MAEQSMPIQIKSFARIQPMLYAYKTPEIARHDGWLKIGYTEKQSVQERVAQQTKTVDVKAVVCWQDIAMFRTTGEYFKDHDFHAYMETHGIVREPKTEWFAIGLPQLKNMFYDFANGTREPVEEGYSYQLRREQEDFVEATKAYFDQGGTEFLWNAKPRFGKTLSAYDLVLRCGFINVLIVTNRPSIANSWAEDFRRFIAGQCNLAFVSDTDALKDKPGVISREAYTRSMRSSDTYDGMVAFESLQGLKGSIYFGGKYDKLSWMAKRGRNGQKGMTFDLLIIDESQEGVDTMKTERAFDNIDRRHTLYLSGTPFKALADGRFRDDQIKNWSYADEQEAKAKWAASDHEAFNPYEALPRLSMYTYKLSSMIYDQVQRGIDLSGEDGSVDFAFDLNEFFATNESGRFVHETEVKKFLKALSTQEKHPYSTPQLRAEMSHTLWLLNRVASAKALARLLKDDEVFGAYEIVLAAGDGVLEDDSANEKAFDRVKEVIASYDKTITLSVGQLTVGVTIPEWSGILMLCSLQSPSAYMQAAFRAQNPCTYTGADGKLYRKETAYVFDFDPARTLIIFDEFANNLSPSTASGKGTTEARKENIKRLLNFFPVLGEDEEGAMVELDAAQVLSIPRRIKCTEVVRHGFMSNYLFRNIGVVFSAPAVVKDILEKLNPAQEDRTKRDPKTIQGMDDVPVNEEGEVDVPQEIVIGRTQDLFGPKIYEDLTESIQPALAHLRADTDDPTETRSRADALIDTIKAQVKDSIFTPAATEYDLKRSTKNRLEKELERDIDRDFGKLRDDFAQETQILDHEYKKAREEAETPGQVQAADQKYAIDIQNAAENFLTGLHKQLEDTVKNKPAQLVEKLEKQKAEEEKHTIEDDIRARLRGFCRTIPSFIMAYGDVGLTLQNFDDYTEDDVFLEVTGITEEQFRFLRDGGDYEDENGETAHFAGQIFDETVFDDSIQEFLNKRTELADYFDETHDEDIFDYIPPQKTNQIFTPRWIVEKMADELERENPGCFDDPANTFADLYMKSGLYITEIVKRLYRSERMKEQIPDDSARIRHILRRQVYGMAPTRIIYLIATNYILGFDEAMKAETKNFVQADAAEAAKEGTLKALVDECFGA